MEKVNLERVITFIAAPQVNYRLFQNAVETCAAVNKIQGKRNYDPSVKALEKRYE